MWLKYSAKNYINNYDTNFLNHFINVGYKKTVFKDDLINSGLMTLDEISQIEDFRGIKVTLLENDKFEYTISRLSSTKDYTNEELLQMINELKEQVNNNNSNSNIFLKSYPVGSIYISTSSTNPGSTYGGTWVEYGKGRTLVGVDNSDSDFNTVEKIGGENKHAHYESLTYVTSNGNIYIGGKNYNGTMPANNPPTGGDYINASIVSYTNKTQSTDSYRNYNASTESSLQPYITVYIWKRTE